MAKCRKYLKYPTNSNQSPRPSSKPEFQMKAIITAWILAASVASANLTEDGKGFFPVVVQVVEAKSGTPINGAKVRIESALAYKETELDPERQTKILPESLGKPVATNLEGVAVVFYHAGWASSGGVYSRSLNATVVVEQDGKEIFRCSLSEWAKKNHFEASSNSAPWIVVSPASKEKKQAQAVTPNGP